MYGLRDTWYPFLMGKKKRSGLVADVDSVVSHRFDFSEAVVYAKEGKLLARESWERAWPRGTRPWIFIGRVGFIHTPPNFPVAAVESAPCFFYFDGKGVFHAGWAPTFEDMRAEDWVVVTNASLD